MERPRKEGMVLNEVPERCRTFDSCRMVEASCSRAIAVEFACFMMSWMRPHIAKARKSYQLHVETCKHMETWSIAWASASKAVSTVPIVPQSWPAIAVILGHFRCPLIFLDANKMKRFASKQLLLALWLQHQVPTARHLDRPVLPRLLPSPGGNPHIYIARL